MQRTPWHYPPAYPYPQDPHPQPARRSDNHITVSLAIVAVGATLAVVGLATRGATVGLVLLVVGSVAVLLAVLTNFHHPLE
jgi:hypothetical protein